MVDVGADAVVLLVAFTGKSAPYAVVPVNIGLAAVDVDIGIMSGVDSKSVPYAVVLVNIGLAAVDVDIGIMSGVDSKSVPYAVVLVNIGLAAVDVDIGIMSGVDSKSVPYAVVLVNIGLAAVDVDIGIMSGVDSKSVPYAVVLVNIGLAAVDVDIGIMSGVDSKSVPYAVVVNVRLDVDIWIKSGVVSKSVPYVVVPVNIVLAAVDVVIGIMTGVDESFVVVALFGEEKLMFATSGDIVDTGDVVNLDCSVDVDFVVSDIIVALFSTACFGVEDDVVVVSWTGPVFMASWVVSLVFIESAVEVAMGSDCEISVTCASSIVAAVEVSCTIDVCEGSGISDVTVTVVIALPQISNKPLHPLAVHTPAW